MNFGLHFDRLLSSRGWLRGGAVRVEIRERVERLLRDGFFDRLGQALGEGELLFSSKILTRPALKRIVARSPVGSLHAVLNGPAARGVSVEHVYDC